MHHAAMQEFLEYVARLLIEHPEEMVVTKTDAPRRTIFKLRLRQTDVGKVIGKHGAGSIGTGKGRSAYKRSVN